MHTLLKSRQTSPSMIFLRPGRRGFTITELMVAVAVASILVALAAPSFSSLIANQRAKAVAANLYVSLSKARSEALKRNASVQIVPIDGQWNSGWRMPDPSDDTNARMIEQQGASSRVAITGPASVTYRSSGRLDAGSIVQFQISPTDSTSIWCVSVDLSGRPYQKAGTCG